MKPGQRRGHRVNRDNGGRRVIGNAPAAPSRARRQLCQVMADNKEESNPERWLTQPGELFLVSPDGTKTRIGQPSAETLEYIERLKEADAALAAALARRAVPKPSEGELK
jgi:hypothetical protein